MDTVVQLQPAMILHHRPYRETSLLMDVFTRDFGVVSVLAKGVRKEKSKLAGILLPFCVLKISYLNKIELKLLTQAEQVHNYVLQHFSLYCGFYVNELLQNFLHHHDPHPELFHRYRRCLADLSRNASNEEILRYFELDLLRETGYLADLELDCLNNEPIREELHYSFSPGMGMAADCSGAVSGDTLVCLLAQAPLSQRALGEAKLLLRNMLDTCLAGKHLKSREVLASIVSYL